MDDSFSAFDDLVERVSSWQKLVHTVGYVLRFIRRLKKTRNRAESTTLSFEEIKAARLVCLRNSQACFGEDRMLLQTNQPLRNRSQLSKLAPFIGSDDLLRVGGRLRQSKLPEEVKRPILLPKAHRITKLILEHEHWVNLHPGTSALFVITRQRYWIIGARNLIRKVTHNCIRCFRQRHHTTHQLMADLPSIRITQSLPFVNSGCDYAGPIILKDRKGRNAKKSKGYICLFVCLVTSALHLELATDLSTEAFLAALRRFMSLRGKCAQIYSDNGRNFVGAKRALDEMQQLLASTNHRDLVSQTLADEGINWVFIPPYAPRWGGKWESSVRSVKLHLRRIIGNTILLGYPTRSSTSSNQCSGKLETIADHLQRFLKGTRATSLKIDLTTGKAIKRSTKEALAPGIPHYATTTSQMGNTASECGIGNRRPHQGFEYSTSFLATGKGYRNVPWS
nr:uncharacterized protein LOC122321439 [Drosophila bipectinata]